MSDLILPAGMVSEMPNLRTDREQAQWWEGKISRREVAVQVNNLTKQFNEKLDKELFSVSKMMSNVFNLARVNGLQTETLIRLLETAVPGYKDNFDIEFKKTLHLVGFLDAINPPGQHSQKPIKERIQLVRDYNAIEGCVKAKGEHFNLEDYIVAHPDEFSVEEREELSKEFEMKLPEMPPTVVVQESAPAGLDATITPTVLVSEPSVEIEV